MNYNFLAAGEYTYLEFHSDIIPLKMVIWGIYAGILIGIAVSYFRKKYFGTLVRKLLKSEAFSEESALTLEEAGLKAGVFYKNALKERGALRRYISFSDTSPVSIKEISKNRIRLRKFFGLDENPLIYDFSKIKLYIPEELKYKADVAFEKKNEGIGSFILLTIILTAFAVGISYLIPELLTMLDNFLKIISENR